jgi:hypothetical protein
MARFGHQTYRFAGCEPVQGRWEHLLGRHVRQRLKPLAPAHRSSLPDAQRHWSMSKSELATFDEVKQAANAR